MPQPIWPFRPWRYAAGTASPTRGPAWTRTQSADPGPAWTRTRSTAAITAGGTPGPDPTRTQSRSF
jgi:hypothetical protein